MWYIDSYLSPQVGPQNVAYIDKELSGKDVLIFSSIANAINTIFDNGDY